MSYLYVFGPVLSGRLGRSLGLDLLGRKICSFDCLYCEVGPNPERTLERRAYVPTEAVLEELTRWRREHPGPLDYVTLAGQGEPCLHSELGLLLAEVGRILPGVPRAVLTNSSLLGDAQVRRELALAEAVLPSLDSLVPEEFMRLNRPHKDVTLERLAEDLLTFRSEYQGRLFLEVFLSRGCNDSEENLARLRDYVPRLAPDRVDVVTLSRPGAYATGRAAEPAVLERFRSVLGPLAEKCSVSGSKDNSAIAMGRALVHEEEAHAGSRSGLREAIQAEAQTGGLNDEVYQSLRRRPQTAAQLAVALGRSESAVAEALQELQHRGLLLTLPGTPRFYKAG